MKAKKMLSIVVALMLTSTNIGITKAENNHWSKDTLDIWKSEGLIKGDENGDLKPESHITRAEFITMVNKAMGYEQSGEKIKQYKDVKETNWYYKDIMTAVEKGYIKGTSKDEISPNLSITRQEVMVIINKIGNLDNQEFEINQIKDNGKISNWSKQAVKNMIANGYIAGYDEQIRPTDKMKRDEAISLIDNYRQNNRTISFKGEYKLGEVNKLTIQTQGVKIKESKIKDIEISDKVKGKIELEKVEITGKIESKSKEVQIYADETKVEIKDGKIEKQISKTEQEKKSETKKSQKEEQRSSGGGGGGGGSSQSSSTQKEEPKNDKQGKNEDKKVEIPDKKYKDGVYKGTGGGFYNNDPSRKMEVELTIKDNKIAEFKLLKFGDDDIFKARYQAFEDVSLPKMKSDIKEVFKIYNSILNWMNRKPAEYIDVATGATYSNKGVMLAIQDALKQAEIKDSNQTVENKIKDIVFAKKPKNAVVHFGDEIPLNEFELFIRYWDSDKNEDKLVKIDELKKYGIEVNIPQGTVISRNNIKMDDEGNFEIVFTHTETKKEASFKFQAFKKLVYVREVKEFELEFNNGTKKIVTVENNKIHYKLELTEQEYADGVKNIIARDKNDQIINFKSLKKSFDTFYITLENKIVEKEFKKEKDFMFENFNIELQKKKVEKDKEKEDETPQDGEDENSEEEPPPPDDETEGASDEEDIPNEEDVVEQEEGDTQED